MQQSHQSGPTADERTTYCRYELLHGAVMVDCTVAVAPKPSLRLACPARQAWDRRHEGPLPFPPTIDCTVLGLPKAFTEGLPEFSPRRLWIYIVPLKYQPKDRCWPAVFATTTKSDYDSFCASKRAPPMFRFGCQHPGKICEPTRQPQRPWPRRSVLFSRPGHSHIRVQINSMLQAMCMLYRPFIPSRSW